MGRPHRQRVETTVTVISTPDIRMPTRGDVTAEESVAAFGRGQVNQPNSWFTSHDEEPYRLTIQSRPHPAENCHIPCTCRPTPCNRSQN